MTLLVTGADGFVGRHALPHLLADGWGVMACHRVDGSVPSWASTVPAARWTPLDLEDDRSVSAAVAPGTEAILHLAAVASGQEARENVGRAWNVNAAGTARLCEAASRLRREGGDPLVLVVSTGEVYGVGGPAGRREDDPTAPVSPYASSKLGAEVAALEVMRRTGLRSIVARPFAHTGPGQTERYVVPALASRLQAAAKSGAQSVPVGNLDPVRDFLDVRDVADAYVRLLRQGRPGEVYNIASGVGVSLRDLFDRLAALIGVDARPVRDSALTRAADLPHLVGDSTKLRQATGWKPALSFDQSLRDLVNAQAN